MSHSTMTRLVLTWIALTTAGLAAGPEPTRKVIWDFEADAPGGPAEGLVTEVGRWEVAPDGKNRVFAQRAESPDAAFNLALTEQAKARDLDLSVRLRAVDGKVDRGGGLVWRAKDKANYYVARYNPLENNLRAYKVVNGVRTQLGTADVPGDLAWHTLRVSMLGSKMMCQLDGKTYLEVVDATFAGPGLVGLWTKADARTDFDDLTLAD